MIKLKLKWSNCFSYGEDNELELGSDTLTQLVGTNGTGKVLFLLYWKKFYLIKTPRDKESRYC